MEEAYRAFYTSIPDNQSWNHIIIDDSCCVRDWWDSYIIAAHSNFANSPVFIFIELTCAHARWALMHHFASVCHWTKIHWIIIHISGSIAPRVVEFDMGMDLDAIWVDLQGQGHGSKVKVTR